MNTILVLAAVFFAVPAVAANNTNVNIACWDVKSVSGSRPLLTMAAQYNAQRPEGASLLDITFFNSDAEYQYLPATVGDILFGREVTSTRNPHVGNYSYQLLDGLRLFFTKDVSPAGLRDADVDGRGQGHAAVLEIEPSVHKKISGGTQSIRMHCREGR